MPVPASLPAAPVPARSWAVVSFAVLSIDVLTDHGLVLRADAILSHHKDRGLAVAAFLTQHLAYMRATGLRAFDPCVCVAVVTRVDGPDGDVWRVDAVESPNHIQLNLEPAADRYLALEVVGRGPEFSRGRADRRGARDLVQLRPGDVVDVLLDDGRIIRSTLRVGVSIDAHLAFIEGIVGGYSVGRVRPKGGFANLAGYRYASEVANG